MYKALYIANGIKYLSTGAGFPPSTVWVFAEPLFFLAPFMSLWGFMVDANSLRKSGLVGLMLLLSFFAAQCEECKYTTTGSQPQSFAALEMLVLQPGSRQFAWKPLRLVSGGTVLGRAGPRGIDPAKAAIQVPYKALRKVKVGNCVDTLSVKRSQMPVAAVTCCVFLYLIPSCRMAH